MKFPVRVKMENQFKFIKDKIFTQINLELGKFVHKISSLLLEIHACDISLLKFNIPTG